VVYKGPKVATRQDIRRAHRLVATAGIAGVAMAPEYRRLGPTRASHPSCGAARRI